MEMQFYFKDMASSDSLRNYAESKILEKIGKLTSRPVSTHVTFSRHHPQNKVHLHLYSGDGGCTEVQATEENMYAAVDRAIDKFDVQLRRNKEKIKGHRNIFARAFKLGDLFTGSYSKLTRFGRHAADENARKIAELVDADVKPIDADDVLKLEKARLHTFHQTAQGVAQK